MFDMVVGGETYKEYLLDLKSKFFITQGEATPENYNNDIHIVKERIYLYLGDEDGNIKIWDLLPVIERSHIKKVPSIQNVRTAFNPYRQEKVNCTDLAT